MDIEGSFVIIKNQKISYNHHEYGLGETNEHASPQEGKNEVLVL